MASPYALDFSPLSNALQANVRNKLAEREMGLAEERQGFARELHPLQVKAQQQTIAHTGKMQPLELKGKQLEIDQAREAAQQRKYQKALAFFEAQGDNFEKLPPDQQAKHWNTLRNSSLFDDDDRKMFADPVYKQLWDDPVMGFRMVRTLGSKHRDALDKDALLASTAAKRAEAEKDLALAAQARAKPPGIIKEGDKPLVVFESGADGKLTARVAHDGGQGNTVSNISGGMRELHDIPTRYGGDKGTFGSAVGSFQGDPSFNYGAGPLSRIWGSLSSYTATGAGSAAPPAEVRRAIEGATNTLAASLKPLIRKPGEGTWSDRDQAVLDSIVGNLTRANSVEQYDRELENVRLRIKANFNIDLPALARKANTDRLPADTQQGAAKPANPPIKEGTTATNPRTGERIIYEGGLWRPL